MTAVPSLLTWDCVGYCANEAGAAARQQASKPNPRLGLADRMIFLWSLDMMKSSFSLSADRIVQAKSTTCATKSLLILAFTDSRANRQSENKMRSVGHCVFRFPARLNQIRILALDPQSGFSFFFSAACPARAAVSMLPRMCAG